ncbi:MAG: rhamnulokinase [Clostridiales bacterium]|nr:rhamnulokinase [Clostridiales bacterium]
MANVKRVLAFDFGASSGRAMIGAFDGDKIELTEIHRFSNDPVIVGDTMYWDTLRLFHEIKQGILKAKHAGGFDSLAIDTWGVDFGLIDEFGKLVENPIHYRDKRTEGMIEEAFKLIPRDDFYKETGIQFMELNTVFQLLSLIKERPHIIERADKLLLTPDLFNYFLTGKKKSEYSIASTTQILNGKTRTWSKKVMYTLGIPERLFTEIVPSGTVIGKLSDEICEELDIEPVDVIAVASHDTQSALLSVPTSEDDFIFISSGTWSLFGTETDEPIINETSFKYNFTNEGGYKYKTSFLKNIIGLWLIQESRRQWIREGEEYGFGELEDMARKAKPFKCFIDPDAPEFVPAGNIPERIQEYCRRTNQEVPETKGEIVRCINESLALKYRYTYEQIKECTKKDYNAIHMVGGGIKSKLLCQFTADSCNCRVIAGPVEATVMGNIALQLMVSGEIKDLKHAREVIAKSPDIVIYETNHSKEWEDAYKRYVELLNA